MSRKGIIRAGPKDKTNVSNTVCSVCKRLVDSTCPHITMTARQRRRMAEREKRKS